MRDDHPQDEDDAVMGTPTRSRLGSASRFGTSDRPATSTGLLNRPSSSSSFHKPSTTTARSSLAHVTPIAERPSRVRPNTASNTASTTTTSRPMSATKTRLMGQYASLGKLAMATPRGGKENVGSNIPGSARKQTDDAAGPLRLQRAADRPERSSEGVHAEVH